jgi:hypothetical protein
MVDRQRRPARPAPTLRRRLLGAWLGLACGLVLLVPGAATAALEGEDRVVVGEAFRAADRRDWQRAFRIIAEVDAPLPAKALRWLRMIEEREPARSARCR